MPPRPIRELARRHRNSRCLPMIVRQQPAESLAGLDHSIQALIPDRSHEPLGVCVHVRRLVRREENLDTGTPEDRLESPREDRVSIDDQEALSRQEACLPIGHVACDLLHPLGRWVRRRSRNVNAPCSPSSGSPRPSGLNAPAFLRPQSGGRVREDPPEPLDLLSKLRVRSHSKISSDRFGFVERSARRGGVSHIELEFA